MHTVTGTFRLTSISSKVWETPTSYTVAVTEGLWQCKPGEGKESPCIAADQIHNEVHMA